MTLATVADYVNDARVLLQDTVAPFRYADADLVTALNTALMEARRLRPDLFVTMTKSFTQAIPSFTTPVDGTAVPMDPMYAPALLYYVVGRVQLRDDEMTQDQRSYTFVQRFNAQMLGLTA